MKNLKVLFTVLCVACATTVWGEIADGIYELCTSTADLVAGDHYIIASGNTSTVYCISNETNSNNRKTVSVTVSDETISVSSESTIMTFTLGGSAGAWTIATDNYSGNAGLLAATSSSKNYLGVVASPGNNGKWEISFSDQKEATLTAQGTYTRKVMQYNYNNGSPIFACYSSASQSACYLYHKSSGSGETTVSFDPESIDFGTVTVGETKSEKVSVAISNATSYISLSVNGSELSVSPSSLSQNGKVTVTYTPTAAGSLNGTLTASGGGLKTNVTASITATAQASYTVTWKVGSDESHTTKVASGSKATPPADFEPTASMIGSCADTFMGWTTAPITSPQPNAPDVLFTDQSPNAITANTTFYAVFATKQSGN